MGRFGGWRAWCAGLEIEVVDVGLVERERRSEQEVVALELQVLEPPARERLVADLERALVDRHRGLDRKSVV